MHECDNYPHWAKRAHHCHFKSNKRRDLITIIDHLSGSLRSPMLLTAAYNSSWSLLITESGRNQYSTYWRAAANHSKDLILVALRDGNHVDLICVCFYKSKSQVLWDVCSVVPHESGILSNIFRTNSSFTQKSFWGTLKNLAQRQISSWDVCRKFFLCFRRCGAIRQTQTAGKHCVLTLNEQGGSTKRKCVYKQDISSNMIQIHGLSTNFFPPLFAQLNVFVSFTQLKPASNKRLEQIGRRRWSAASCRGNRRLANIASPDHFFFCHSELIYSIHCRANTWMTK